MADLKNDEKCFTFTWRLENASYCLQKTGEEIASPTFVVEEIFRTKWKLSLYPRGDSERSYISCYLYRKSDNPCEDSLEIKYELAFIVEAGSALDYTEYVKFFKNGDSYGFKEFAKRDDVFILKRSSYLPNDTLTVRCKIWKNVGDMVENIQCFARTSIGIEKRSFLWRLEDFSALEPEEKCTRLINSLEKGTKLMSLNLFLSGGLNCDEIIRSELTCHDKDIQYCVLKLFLVDKDGRRVGCYQDEFWFDKLGNTQQFTLCFSKQMLMEKSSLYLPDDALSLQWELVFSKGVVSEEIEEVQDGSLVLGSKFLMPVNE